MALSMIEQIFNGANGFRIVALRAEESKPNPDGKTFQSVPFQGRVNAAFSCELYLKGILKYLNINVRGHNLEKLFSHLPEKIQDEIIEQAINKDSNNNKSFLFVVPQVQNCNGKTELTLNISNISNKETFMNKLKNVSEMFSDWRYLYEGDTAKKVNIDNSFILLFMNVLYQVSLSYRKLDD